jgi:catechol 2,3-dioxygenase-like lactoylglutathione lyase family enzyme
LEILPVNRIVLAALLTYVFSGTLAFAHDNHEPANNEPSSHTQAFDSTSASDVGETAMGDYIGKQIGEGQLGLRRYEGRYLVEDHWDDDDMHILRFFDVSIADDHLAVREQSRNHLHGEEPPGEAYGLAAASEHTFDAVGHPHTIRFVIDDSDVAQSIIVIQDGVSSDPCPRFIPAPPEIPGRRERAEDFDLGHPGLCMPTQDTEVTLAFYERLGFARNEWPGLVSQGANIIAFFDFLEGPIINYRGPSILATGTEFAKRGYSLYQGSAVINHIRGDEAGGFIITDPDGHCMFFNTHAPERPRYDAWINRTKPPDEDGFHPPESADTPVTVPLGDLVVCLDVTDLDASVSFYQGMGFEIIEQAPGSTMLFSEPVVENRFAFPIWLRQADEPHYGFGFLCADVAGVSAEIEARGIEMIDTSDGPTFVDPDGNRVTLFPARITPTSHGEG